MSLSARLTATLTLTTLLAGMPALHAFAEERCEGTLCDLYYGAGGGNPKPQTAVPAGSTPITVPTGGILGFLANPAAPAGAPAQVVAPRVAVQGGGLVDRLNGVPEERCTGTLCDLFYGGPPPAKPEPPPSQQRPALATAEAPRNALASGEAPEDASTVRFETREVVREAKPRCVAPPSDPWRCYR